jgi:predicted nuclease with TOPRIM domain
MNFCQFEKCPLENLKKKKTSTKINKKQTKKTKNKNVFKSNKKSKNDDYKHILTEMNQMMTTMRSNRPNTSKIENDIEGIKNLLQKLPETRGRFEKNILDLQTQMKQVLSETSELREDINKIKENYGQLDTKNIDKTSELSVSLNPSETLIISDDEMITEPIVEKANTITIPVGNSEFRTGHDQFLTKAIQKGGIGLVRQNTEVKALLTQHNEEQKTISTSVKETLDEAN